MPKEALTKHTLYLREGDYDFIRDTYAAKGVPAALIIRKIVSRFVDEVSAASQSDVEQIKLKVKLDE